MEDRDRPPSFRYDSETVAVERRFSELERSHDKILGNVESIKTSVERTDSSIQEWRKHHEEESRARFAEIFAKLSAIEQKHSERLSTIERRHSDEDAVRKDRTRFLVLAWSVISAIGTALAIKALDWTHKPAVTGAIEFFRRLG